MEIKRGIAVSPGVAIGPALVVDTEGFRIPKRMIEKKQLLADKPGAGNVTAFLRAAVPMGYELGRTPLNAFLKTASARVPPD